jgi:hypothetical protein
MGMGSSKTLECSDNFVYVYGAWVWDFVSVWLSSRCIVYIIPPVFLSGVFYQSPCVWCLLSGVLVDGGV